MDRVQFGAGSCALKKSKYLEGPGTIVGAANTGGGTAGSPAPDLGLSVRR